jgi:hypothetical protein
MRVSRARRADVLGELRVAVDGPLEGIYRVVDVQGGVVIEAVDTRHLRPGTRLELTPKALSAMPRFTHRTAHLRDEPRFSRP